MEELKVGSEVQIIPEAFFLNNNKKVSEDILKLKVYIREIKKDGTCIVARAKVGPVLGTILMEDLKPYSNENVAEIEPYIIQIKEKNTPLYNDPREHSNILRHLERFSLFTIVNEKNGFGKIKKGSGWVKLDSVAIL